MFLLFDIDGTLVPSGQHMSVAMQKTLQRLAASGVRMALIGGGAYAKLAEQCGSLIDNDTFTYVCSEMGCVVHDGRGHPLHTTKSMTERLASSPDDHHLVHGVLQPLFRRRVRESGFVPSSPGGWDAVDHFDVRTGLIYCSAVGMQASTAVRAEFVAFDRARRLLDHLLMDMRALVPSSSSLQIARGGSVGLALSFYDKTEALRFLQQREPNETEWWFFGDRCEPDGNDWCLYTHAAMRRAYAVESPADTLRHLRALLRHREEEQEEQDGDNVDSDTGSDDTL